MTNPKLEKYFTQLGIPLYYKNKQSFGDIDIVVATGSDFGYDMRNLIEEEFSPKEIFHNGDCWSFDFEEIQVDLITVKPIHFESNLMYLSYNLLGMLIGRLAHQFGVKYGQEGLYLNHNFKGGKIARIPVSKDYKKIYEFFGLDFSKWIEGFNELEDIFAFITSSPYFDWKIFQMEALNGVNRARNLKRKPYMDFLVWINENGIDKEYSFDSKEFYMDKAIEYFPEGKLQLAIREAEYFHCKKLYIRSKFNGQEIMKMTGFKGKMLGDVINQFKATFFDFDKWVLDNSIEHIYFTFNKFLGSSEWGGA